MPHCDSIAASLARSVGVLGASSVMGRVVGAAEAAGVPRRAGEGVGCWAGAGDQSPAGRQRAEREAPADSPSVGNPTHAHSDRSATSVRF